MLDRPPIVVAMNGVPVGTIASPRNSSVGGFAPPLAVVVTPAATSARTITSTARDHVHVVRLPPGITSPFVADRGAIPRCGRGDTRADDEGRCDPAGTPTDSCDDGADDRYPLAPRRPVTRGVDDVSGGRDCARDSGLVPPSRRHVRGRHRGKRCEAPSPPARPAMFARDLRGGTSVPRDGGTRRGRADRMR